MTCIGKKLFPCHLCDFTTTDKDTFANHIVSWHQVAQAVQEGESILGHPLLKVFSKTTDMAWSSLKKVMNQLDLVKVEVPGNGFCFISSLLVALAEQGINKNYDILSIDIMNEIDRYYESMIDETGFHLVIKRILAKYVHPSLRKGTILMSMSMYASAVLPMH